MPSCYHCQEQVTTGDTFSVNEQGQQRVFCCPACLAIYQTIHGSNLQAYYKNRQQKAQKSEPVTYNLLLDEAFQKEHIQLDGDTASCKLFIENMHCTACAWLIEKQLSQQAGVIKARVNYQEQSLLLQWLPSLTTLKTLLAAVDQIGYRLQIYQSNDAYQILQQQSRKLLQRLGISFLLMMQIGMLSIALYAGEFLGITEQMRRLLEVFSLVFTLPALYFSATPFLSSAYNALAHKRLNMDVSISIAIIGLFASSCYSVLQQQGDIYFDSVVMLCFFILISRFVELRSRLALQKNNALLPSTAKKIISNQVQLVKANSINKGEIIAIHPGDIVPLDGDIIEGSSSFSEALINGEATPVAKGIGERVFAASHNHDGFVKLRVSDPQSLSLAAKMQHAADTKRLHKAPQQSLTDKISGHFTIVMLLLALASFVYWFLQGNSQAYWIALSVLVVSCPCALSLAAPTANSVMHKFFKDRGIFIQSELLLEQLPNITDICFDKTGTLTEGNISIESMENISQLSNANVLAIASQLQSSSHHPISFAFAPSTKLASDVKLVAQKGVEAQIENTRYRIGSVSFCQQWHPGARPKNPSAMVIGLCNRQQLIAWFYLHDPIRPNAKSLMCFLHSQQKQLHILSGDPSSQVAEIAKTLNIQHVQQAMTSEAKSHYVQQLQQQNKHVLMLGDGINDAEVLASAEVSATLFNASDFIKNTADIVFMKNNLQLLQQLLTGVKKHQKILKENFFWAFLYNGLAIPFAMAGFVTPLMAAVGMSLSSIIVVMNSKRLSKES